MLYIDICDEMLELYGGGKKKEKPEASDEGSSSNHSSPLPTSSPPAKKRVSSFFLNFFFNVKVDIIQQILWSDYLLQRTEFLICPLTVEGIILHDESLITSLNKLQFFLNN